MRLRISRTDRREIRCVTHLHAAPIQQAEQHSLSARMPCQAGWITETKHVSTPV